MSLTCEFRRLCSSRRCRLRPALPGAVAALPPGWDELFSGTVAVMVWPSSGTSVSAES